MNTFEDRKRSFEEKFAKDQEIQFKVNARKNKYLAEWVSKLLNKGEEEKKDYLHQIIKSDFEEPGDEDVFRKLKNDFANSNISIEESEIRKQMDIALENAKKDFI